MAAESVLVSVAEKIIERLGSLALEEIGLLWNVKDELRKMKNSVTAIKAVLLDAEEKQDTNAGVREWVERLKDAALDADDLLDDFSTEALHQELMTQNKKGKKVRNFFSKSNQLVYGCKMGHKLREIRGKLDEIANDRIKFGFSERSPEARVVIRERKQTHSFVRDKDVIGREEEKNTIIKILLNDNVKENVVVVPIVGIGGLGKTTLAQLVFNDKIIQDHFELIMWVCVSDVFDVQSIVAKIIGCSTNIEMEQLQRDLREKIDGKRYLLVLDDVWNENKQQWVRLMSLLLGGAMGSRIMVTTRLEKVAEITRTFSSFRLKGLDNDKSWVLFARMAFGNGEPQNQDLIAIGEEIVRKCMGVPLAIRTIGSMLYLKNSENDWLYFKNTDLLKINQQDNDTFPILKLSYDHLSPYLKNCFAYCSLFPKDYPMNKKTLIQLWMAQGFIQPSNENRCIEDVGEEYFMDLYWRSFFQDIENDEYGNIEVCKMHDLIHDLAQSVAGNEYTMTNLEGEKIGETTRHVSINATNLDFSSWKIPTRLADQIRKLRSFLLPCHHGKFDLRFQQINTAKVNKLRSFLLPSQNIYFGGIVALDTAVYDSVISCFKCLRVLDLHLMCNKTLPKSIGSLKHLRYLDLSGNENIRMLPSSVTSLHNLQALILTECNNLEELPKDTRNLMSLRHLELDSCNKLTHMPYGLGQLTSLQTLTDFVLNKKHGGSISELSSLNNLRGSLKIRGLKNMRCDAAQVKAAKLVEKPFLKCLTLSWEGDTVDEDINDTTDMFSKDELLLENLQPHSKIKSLTVCNFGGMRFCDWLSSISNLFEIAISGCKRLQYLPPLHRLPHLDHLSLKSMSSLEYIDCDGSEEECSCLSSPLFFPSLKSLVLQSNPNLRGWWRRSSSEVAAKVAAHQLPSFSFLSELEIYDCPNLISMPLCPYVEHFTCIGVIEKLLSQFLKPQTTTAGRSQALAPLQSSSSSLSHPSLPFTSRSLIIGNIQNLESFPKELLPNFTSLRSLIIEKCLKLKSVSPLLQNLSALHFLRISTCKELDLSNDEEDGDYGMRWKELSSLRTLFLYDIPKLVSLPEGLQHVTTLGHLFIFCCDNLLTLPEWIGNFKSSLLELHIFKCPKLTSLPEGIRNVRSLRKLEITGCPQLEVR
ncbi:NBS-LRR type disease resistance protein [Quillaja saponaria]|uniref:NBS-LRR type disease resistance protein n=1 Tax=Quillaja saponaria TaxID=32244 RepID=A0AAD7L0J6_QUISA|nr:NBS-LRR type disease resistance protein [Quillaja saponaria]